MNKYIKFLREIEDSDSNFTAKAGDIIPLAGWGEDEVMGKYYFTIINGEKYYYPEKFKEGCFEIV